MSIPPYSFGSVLYDELQQLAVRRGEFVSLKSLRDEVVKVKWEVAKSGNVATDPAMGLRSLRKGSDDLARKAEEVLRRVSEAARAINELRQVVQSRCDTAKRIVEQICKPAGTRTQSFGPGGVCDKTPTSRPPSSAKSGTLRAGNGTVTGNASPVGIRDRRADAPIPDSRPRPFAFWSLLGVFRVVEDLIHTQSDPTQLRAELQKVPARIDTLDDVVKAARRMLHFREDQGPVALARAADDQFVRLCRLARGLKDFEDLKEKGSAAADEARALLVKKVGTAFDNRTAEEQLSRGAVIQRAIALRFALDKAVERLERIREAYCLVAKANRGIATEVSGLIRVQSDAARYELFDMLEDGARSAAMRTETVGLAFSGGGIRSATFNLGFLQGMASLRMLKRFDYLSTVSGGGYIGAWFAAWVRREGGPAGDPSPPSEEAIAAATKREIARRRAEIISAPPKPSRKAVRAMIEQAAARIRDRARAKLLEEHRAKVAANEALPAEQRATAPEPPDEDAVQSAADREIRNETARIRRKAQEHQLRKRLKEIDDHTGYQVAAELRENYEAECRSKRSRTARALENVEIQLNTSRVVQKKADRRWVSSREISDGRETIVSPPPMLKRVVDEEPGPIQHLRSYSNYLAPKVGLLSIDTWTMVSVYLRNLLLNQFILLPMTLAAIAVPRLMLLLFASGTDEPILTLARRWVNEHPGWLVFIPLAGGCLAILTITKLVDYFAHDAVTRFEARYPSMSGWTIVALLTLGVAAAARELTDYALPSFAMMWFRTIDPGKLPPVVKWFSDHSWVAAFAVLAVFFLASFSPRRPLRKLAWRITHQFSQRTKGWMIIFLLILGATAWVGRLSPWLIDLLASMPAWVPPLLLAPLAVILLRLWFRDGAIARVAAAVVTVGLLSSTARWLDGEMMIFVCTFLMAWFGFWRTYKMVALIRESRKPASAGDPNVAPRFDLPLAVLCEQILFPFTLVAFGVSMLFSRPGKPYFSCPVPWVDGVFNPASWGNSTFVAALFFGVLVGTMRLLSFILIDLWDPFRPWKGFERAGRAAAAFVSGLVAGAGLAGVLMALTSLLGEPHWPGEPSSELAAAMMSFGPLLVFAAIGAGSAIEVGLIGHYGEEDMREWRASLGAYLLIVGTLWAMFSALSIYGPLLIWKLGKVAASAAGVAWVVTSVSGALAGRSARTDGVKIRSSPLEYVALAAPPVFVVGLVVSVAMLATLLQGVEIPLDPKDSTASRKFLDHLVGNSLAGSDLRLMSAVDDVGGMPTANKSLIVRPIVDSVLHFRIFNGDGEMVVDTAERRPTEQTPRVEDLRKLLERLWTHRELTPFERDEVIAAITSIVGPSPVGPRTWIVLLASAWIATVACVYININLFGLNAFYANRLVRCYLGASRPREAPAEGRPNFAPTNSPAPVRRPNPITGFDPTDDFPMHDLAVVPKWGDDDLVVDYRGPYHLVNAAMNLVAGSELAWQERMAESFVFSPLYCGSKTTGYRPTLITKGDLHPNEMDFDEVPLADSYDLRLIPPVNDLSEIPTAGKSLIILAVVGQVLHFRIFDGNGKRVLDTNENRLTEQARQIGDLRKHIARLWPPHELTKGQKVQIIAAVRSIVGHALADHEVLPGYGDGVRLGTAVSVSGAAASPNAGYHSSPLVAILMTVLNARLGLWFGNPARESWRRSGPGFAHYLFDELFGRTTSKGKYVYLSDGGHFENLGVYELIRRRCRHIVLCDAGADPSLSFWDLGSLVRKCREDFGVRIEIDISPLLKKEGSPYARWHCAVGRIHYDDVDVEANPGTLFYVKPSLTGDEPSDIRNYVVDHPTFPHESTADQFFSESQFESYRALGEHIAVNVFRDVQRDAGPMPHSGSLFARLRRSWCPPPPDLDKNFIQSVKGFVEIHKDFRGDTKLEKISRELYPELEELLASRSNGAARNGDGNGEVDGSRPGGYDNAEVHAVIQMLQVMENAWLALNLETYSDHPLNRGWMNIYRRWTSSGILQRYWPMVRGEFSEGFVRFCEVELNLTVDAQQVIWLDEGAAPNSGRGLDFFRAAIKALDREFTLEWPDVVSREIGEEPLTLLKMFEHARAFPPPGREPKPRAGLIIPGGQGRELNNAPAEPSHYGTILAWEASDGAIDLVVWVRGAYRTLGLGERIAEALERLKEALKVHSQGYVLRARYPSDDPSKIKQRWQSNHWSEFFQDRGFHRQEPDGASDDMVTFIHRYKPI